MKVDDLLGSLDPSGPLTMKKLADYITANTSDTASVALVYIWRDKGIPPLRQLELENLTGGRLRAGPECDRYRVPALPMQQGQRPEHEADSDEVQDSAPGALDVRAA